MKRFIIASITLLIIISSLAYLYLAGYFYFPSNKEIEVIAYTKDKHIYLDGSEFEIKGVNLGAGKPGHFATDFAITKDEYLRWFKQIKEMGANCIRVYTILDDSFYNAFYEYNYDNNDPLYLIHGVWLNDYSLNSHIGGLDPKFKGQLITDTHDLIDIIHGNKPLYLSTQTGTASGSYTKNISPWVLGYIIGVEWEDVTVAYTDNKHEDKNSYMGKYMFTTKEASPFETMLAELGDLAIDYETRRYSTQRLVAFANWPTTDPFDYPPEVSDRLDKIAKVDVEHIKTADSFKSGTFASYHIYPYYPDYLSFLPDQSQFLDKYGEVNTYFTYLKMINDHHSIPVVVSEFGIPASRGMSQRDKHTGHNQGFTNEKNQATSLQEMYLDIKDAGIAGAIVFSWQDEWFKRTWSTMHYTDLTMTPFWSDYQTNEQFFGILAFDPGYPDTISHVDGDISEWVVEDLVLTNDDYSIYQKQDERYLYLMIKGDNITKDNDIYIPMDVTPKSGSKKANNLPLNFSQDSDFLIVLSEDKESKILVQERYEALRAIFNFEVYGTNGYINPPQKDSILFKPIFYLLQAYYQKDEEDYFLSETYETGLLTMGNSNPNSSNYNSVADYHYSDNAVEIRIPWLLINFSNPSYNIIHDDYYEHFGIEQLEISDIYVGVGIANETINMKPIHLNKWKDKVNYHERLKPAYYALQELWSVTK